MFGELVDHCMGGGFSGGFAACSSSANNILPRLATKLPSMSCADDLTVDDLNNNVTTEVLERVTAGEGSNANLWAFIDKDK